jgi:hypothetical protein
MLGLRLWLLVVSVLPVLAEAAQPDTSSGALGPSRDEVFESDGGATVSYGVTAYGAFPVVPSAEPAEGATSPTAPR